MHAIAAAAAAPSDPGVYFFLDAEGELLYVGKAGHLRTRLHQHARKVEAAATPRDRLWHSLIAEVRWEPCTDEDAAAAREADLIIALRPLLNRSLTTEGRWVYVVTGPAPALTASPQAACASWSRPCPPSVPTGRHASTAASPTWALASARGGPSRLG